MRYQHAFGVRTDLQRLKRDTESARVNRLFWKPQQAASYAVTCTRNALP